MASNDYQDYAPDAPTRRIIAANMAIAGLVLVLMMLFGVLMRLSQGQWLNLDPDVFYQVMTVHGIGMVATATLAGLSIMWYFVGRYVKLHSGVLALNLLLYLVGVVIVLLSVFWGQFGGAWTFLYPLPGVSQGMWSIGAAFWFLAGVLIVGVGFLLVCLEIGRALIVEYHGLLNALGWPYLFGVRNAVVPTKVAVASAMSVIVTTAALIAGAFIMILMMINLLVPSFTLDPLFAKGVIYFFGHTIINATIYMAVTSVYALLPGYANKSWDISRVFVASWMGSTIMVLVIFPHHMMMDFAMPEWMLIYAQILSYTNSFPVLIVTGLGAVALLHRSQVKWDMVSGLLFLAMFGWMAGVVPAVIDATIVVNSVMHNTLWVPGHFHFYLLLGMIPMALAFMYYTTRNRQATQPENGDRWIGAVYALAGLGFVLMFLYSGRQSVPRRWAVHLDEWLTYDRWASVFAILVLLCAAWIVLRFLVRMPRFLAER